MSEDWLGRWAEGRTGWHERTGNAGLKRYWPPGVQSGRVLVPLCGKTPDLLWLAQRGLEVVGVELAEVAVRGFFEEQELEFVCEPHGRLDHCKAKDLAISIYCGDYFDFDICGFTALYDRGALVALPEAERPGYVKHTKRLLAPQAFRFIITLEYDQRVVNGPPFSVPAAELLQYWDDMVRVSETDDIDNCPPKFRQAGLKEIAEILWLSR